MPKDDLTRLIDKAAIVVNAPASGASAGAAVTSKLIKQGVYRTGAAPSAGLANLWGAWNNYLWGVATREYDLVVGFNAFINNSFQNEVIYQASFAFGGNTVLLCDIDFTNAGPLTISIPNDGTTKTLTYTGNGPLTSFDISGGGAVYTVGSEYVITVTLDRGANPSATAIGYWIAAEVSNAVLWPTLASMSDGYVATDTDYAAGTTAQQNLQNIVEVPTGQSIRVTHINNVGVDDTFCVGGLYYRGQDAFTITYYVQNSAPANLTIFGDAGWTDVFALTVDAAEHTDTFQLSSAHYTANTRYRWKVDCASTQTNYVDCTSLGGAKALTSPPQPFLGFGTYKGAAAAGVPGLKPICGSGSTDNLTEISVAARGSPSVGAALKGFQFLAPMAMGASAFQIYRLGPTMRRPHVFRFLYYKGTGSLTAPGSAATTLPDTTSGGWNRYDLDTIASLAYGQFYVLDGISGGFEAVT